MIALLLGDMLHDVPPCAVLRATVVACGGNTSAEAGTACSIRCVVMLIVAAEGLCDGRTGSGSGEATRGVLVRCAARLGAARIVRAEP